MIKKGVYAATLSIIDENGSLNIDETISHAEDIIKEGLHGVFFFGSTFASSTLNAFLILLKDSSSNPAKIPLVVFI